MPPSSPHEPPPRGRRALALALAVGLTAEPALAACASAQAASPFPVVVVESPRPQSHTWAYVALASGAALIGGSFALSGRANDAYDSYLQETEPARIETLYDRAVRYDHLSSAGLITGELLLVGGFYLRFLRPPRPSRISLAIGPQQCALAFRF